MPAIVFLSLLVNFPKLSQGDAEWEKRKEKLVTAAYLLHPPLAQGKRREKESQGSAGAWATPPKGRVPSWVFRGEKPKYCQTNNQSGQMRLQNPVPAWFKTLWDSPNLERQLWHQSGPYIQLFPTSQEI